MKGRSSRCSLYSRRRGMRRPGRGAAAGRGGARVQTGPRSAPLRADPAGDLLQPRLGRDRPRPWDRAGAGGPRRLDLRDPRLVGGGTGAAPASTADRGRCLRRALRQLAYLGYPLTLALLGEDSLPTAVLYDMLVNAPTMLLGAFAVGAAFGTKAGESVGDRVRFFFTRNPLLYAAVAGLLAPDAL